MRLHKGYYNIARESSRAAKFGSVFVLTAKNCGGLSRTKKVSSAQHLNCRHVKNGIKQAFYVHIIDKSMC